MGSPPSDGMARPAFCPGNFRSLEYLALRPGYASGSRSRDPQGTLVQSLGVLLVWFLVQPAPMEVVQFVPCTLADPFVHGRAATVFGASCIHGQKYQPLGPRASRFSFSSHGAQWQCQGCSSFGSGCGWCRTSRGWGGTQGSELRGGQAAARGGQTLQRSVLQDARDGICGVSVGLQGPPNGVCVWRT